MPIDFRTLSIVHQEMLTKHIYFRVEFTAISYPISSNGLQYKRVSLRIDLLLLREVSLITLMSLCLFGIFIRGELGDGQLVHNLASVV